MQEVDLTLTDEKTEHDMEKILNKIDGIRVEMNHKFDNVNSKIGWLKWLVGSIGIAAIISAFKYVFSS